MVKTNRFKKVAESGAEEVRVLRVLGLSQAKSVLNRGADA